jgi:hypothetical protein
MPASINVRTTASNEKHQVSVSLASNNNNTSEATLNTIAQDLLGQLDAAGVTIREGESLSIGVNPAPVELTPPLTQAQIRENAKNG